MEEISDTDNSLDFSIIEHGSTIFNCHSNILKELYGEEQNVSISKSNQDKDFGKENINFDVAHENGNTKFDNEKNNVHCVVPKRKSKLQQEDGFKKKHKGAKNAKISAKIVRTSKKKEMPKRDAKYNSKEKKNVDCVVPKRKLKLQPPKEDGCKKKHKSAENALIPYKILCTYENPEMPYYSEEEWLEFQSNILQSPKEDIILWTSEKEEMPYYSEEDRLDLESDLKLQSPKEESTKKHTGAENAKIPDKILWTSEKQEMREEDWSIPKSEYLQSLKEDGCTTSEIQEISEEDCVIPESEYELQSLQEDGCTTSEIQEMSEEDWLILESEYNELLQSLNEDVCTTSEIQEISEEDCVIPESEYELQSLQEDVCTTSKKQEMSEEDCVIFESEYNKILQSLNEDVCTTSKKQEMNKEDCVIPESEYKLQSPKEDGCKKKRKDAKNAKIRKKVGTSKTQKKPKRERTNPPMHSIFDYNLLRDNAIKKGCECTLNSKYDSPFWKDAVKKIGGKKSNKRLICDKMINKTHVVEFTPKEEMKYLLNRFKPTLYASECITAMDSAMGCKYSLMIRLIKDDAFVGDYVAEHTFTKTEKKKRLEISIDDYTEFDRIYYVHILTAAKGQKLCLAKFFAVKIGESVLMFPSKTIQWTKPGPKVIVEKVEQLSDAVSYY